MTITNYPQLRSINPSRIRIPPGGSRHPQYDYRFYDWVRIRDCVDGERAVKAAGHTYLPAREDQDATEYSVYLGRAVFYNATGRTLEGLFGSIFRRETRIECPPKMAELIKSCTRDSRSFAAMTEDVVGEQLQVGRIGCLVDNYPDKVEAAEKGPFVAVYPAETIVNWAVEEDVLVAVLLTEFVPSDPNLIFQGSTKERYRLLALDENGEYYQAAHSDLGVLERGAPLELRKYPDINGVRMRRIPFTIINADSIGPDVGKPPLLDICDLNLAHYRASAVLENALYYQGTPVYYISGPGSAGDFKPTVGPKVIWLLEKDDKPGILQADGALTNLENSLETKESQIQSLGGKLIGQRKNAAARSAVSEDLSIQGEEAVLLKIVKTGSDGLTMVLQDLAVFSRNDPAKCKVQLNEQFYRPKIGARELRSLISLFDSGLLPTKAAYEQLREAGFLGPDVSFEDFAAVAEEARRRKSEYQEAQTASLEAKTESDTKSADETNMRGQPVQVPKKRPPQMAQ